MSEVDPGQTGAYRRWVMWAVSGIGVAMSLYHLWIIGGGPAVEHVARFTGYDPRSNFPWIWTGPPSAIIYRAGHLLFAVILVFLIYPLRGARGQGNPGLGDIAMLVVAVGVVSYPLVFDDYLTDRMPYVDDPTTLDDRNGAKALPVLLSTHTPLDLVIILLGTNDIKPQNWQHEAEFAADYRELVKSFQSLKSRPKVFVCRPVPVPGKGNYGINEENVQKEIPRVDALAKELGCGVIDMHAALAKFPEMLPDRVHPNTAGAGEMAKAAAKAILGK